MRIHQRRIRVRRDECRHRLVGDRQKAKTQLVRHPARSPIPRVDNAADFRCLQRCIAPCEHRRHRFGRQPLAPGIGDERPARLGHAFKPRNAAIEPATSREDFEADYLRIFEVGAGSGPPASLFGGAYGADRMQRLEWDPLPPWEFRAVIHRDGPQYSLNGVLLRDDQKMDVRVPNLLFSDGLLLAHNRLSRFEPASAFHWLIALRREGAIPFPAKDAVQFQVEVLKGPKLPQIDWPEDMRYEDVHAAPRPTVRIGRNPKVYAAETNSLRAELYFDYGAVSFPWDHAESGFFDAVGRRFIRRDKSFEGKVLERMEQIGMMRNQDAYGPPDPAWELSEKKLPSAVGEMLKAGWHVEAEGKIFQTASSVDMQVTSGIDWFELHGSVQYGSTTVGLPVLLQALRKGETMLRLDDGTFGLLPDEFLQKFGPLLRMGETEDDHVRYSRAQAGILDVFLAERDVQVDAEFQKARERLRGFQGMEPAEQPEHFHGELDRKSVV